MAEFDQELLSAAKLLTRRKVGQKGPLPSARIRRSISTTYYAIFHFILDEVTKRVVGTPNVLRNRRRILARTISHTGAKKALDKVRGRTVDASVAEFFRQTAGTGPVSVPNFMSDLAKTFLDAHAKREDADYNLIAVLSATDARLLRMRVARVIRNWRAAKSKADRDLKHALCVYILMRGEMR